jgi:RNA polymerase sigma-70 factor (ECF subfamily)
MTNTASDHNMQGDGEVDEARSLLLNIAYRLLGSIADGEDAVQEAYARWYRLSPEQRSAIVSPPAWLVRVVSRVCLDVLGSARHRREQYTGEWLPEPIPADRCWTSQSNTDQNSDPVDRITLDESVSMALLVVLESLTPAERVSFVLHDVFRHSFAEIAQVVGRSPAACRQLATSARRRVRSAPDQADRGAPHETIVANLKSAWESGDLGRLVQLLDPSVTAVVDGGGIVSAPLEPVLGAEAVARLLIEVLARQSDLTIQVTTVNGAAGLLARAGAETMAVMSLDASGDRILHIWAVRNPTKLGAWTG